LILTESRSLAGVLRSIAYQYLCAIAATNGQAGGFLVTTIAPILADNLRPVLYLGDLDHQGGQIEANTRHVLERCSRRELDWTRLAITQEQADRIGDPVLKADKRYKPARVQQSMGDGSSGAGGSDASRARRARQLADGTARERERAQRAEWSDRLAG